MTDERGDMSHIVGVRLVPAGRLHYFDATGLDLSTGDSVVVETEDGQRDGRVAVSPGQVLYSDLRGPMFRVLRKS